MSGEYRNILLILVALLAGVQGGYIYFHTPQAEPAQQITREPVEKDGPPTKIEINRSIGSTYHQIFRENRGSVVYISALQASDNGKTQASRGSGFIFDEKGHIVTNSHVIDTGSDYEVTLLDGSTYKAKLVGQDQYTDLAVLKIDTDKALNPLELGQSSQLKVGYPVLAIGNPFGLKGSMTSGIVSQKGRLLPATEGFSIQNVIQTDAAINPGNSGGPLLNIRGELVGVNTAIDTRTRTFSGVGFAIPVSIVKKVIPRLISSGEYKHPWIGVSGTDVTPPIAEKIGLDPASGFLVTSVVEDSPADQAGIQGGRIDTHIRGRQIQLGGDVIVAIDGKKVSKINDILNYLFRNTSVGDTITLTVIRDGKRVKRDLTLDERPEAE